MFTGRARSGATNFIVTRRKRSLVALGLLLSVATACTTQCDCEPDAGPVPITVPAGTTLDPPPTSDANESSTPAATAPAQTDAAVPSSEAAPQTTAASATANDEESGGQTADVPLGTAAFAEAFDDPEVLERFQWQFHHGVSFEQETFSWQGDHDENCGKPSTTRDIEVSEEIILYPDGMGDLDRYGNFVYWCAPGGDGTGHVMTSFNTAGYAQIAFSPDRSFDDVTSICWDQNQTDLGPRKWTQVVVVPEAEYEDNDRRLDYVSPAFFDGPGQGGVQLDEGVFLFEMNRGSTVVNFGPDDREADFAGFVTTDKVRRYRTCLTDAGNGTIAIELERESETETRVFDGAFPDGPARVVFQDDSYNPPKQPGAVDDPFTWHWDNIEVYAT